MAIKIDIVDAHPYLFCDSKWWGDPDLPEETPYPMVDGLPMTFISQVSCFDIEKLDEEEMLPHEGMFYFFADLDEFIDGAPKGIVELPKGSFTVKHAKAINMETFKTIELLDEDDEPIAPKAYPVELSRADDAAGGTMMLSEALPQPIKDAVPEAISLLSFTFGATRLHFVYTRKDLGFGNWKRARLFAEPL